MRGKNPFERFLGPEDIEQINFCKYLALEYPGCKIHHSPNEGKRTPFEQYKLQVLGVSSGFSDLLILYQDQAIAVEMKAIYKRYNEKGVLKITKNPATPEQKEWVAAFNKAHIPAAVCTGFDEAKEFADKHFKKLKPTTSTWKKQI